MKNLIASLASLLLLALAPAARADEPAAPAAPPASTEAPAPAPAPAAPSDGKIGIELAPKVGGNLPLSKLGVTFGVDLEVGYVTPLLDHKLAVVLDAGYTQPSSKKTIKDARVDGGQFNYTVTQRQLDLFLGPKYFLIPLQEQFVPWAALGFKLHLLRTEANGDANGQAFGQNVETATTPGVAVRLGGGLKLGPGHLFGELEGAWGPVSQLVSGNSNVADIGLQVGYMFLF